MIHIDTMVTIFSILLATQINKYSMKGSTHVNYNARNCVSVKEISMKSSDIYLYTVEQYCSIRRHMPYAFRSFFC